MRSHAFLAILLLAACAEEARPPNRGVTGRGAEPTLAAPPANEPARDPFVQSAPPLERPRSSRSARAVATSGAPTQDAPAVAPPAPARDLSDELRTRFGSPASCFSSPATLPARVAVTVSVVLSSSGRVTRAEVSGAGLPERDLTCLRDRALSVQLAAIDDAPRTAQTTLEVERRPAAPPAP